MPKKKKNAPRAFNIRLSPERYQPIEEHRASIEKAVGFKLSFSAYVRHAAQEYPRLRRLEEAIQADARDTGTPRAQYARGLLETIK